MDKYYKYSLSNYPDRQQVKNNLFSPKTGGKGITEASTPKEISKFITTKLVEFIENGLAVKSGGKTAPKDGEKNEKRD